MWLLKVLLVLIVFVVLGLLYSSLPLAVKPYEWSDSRIGDPVRIVFLGDLHNTADSSVSLSLIEKRVTEQKPDVIALVGDMVDDSSSDADIQALVGLVAGLRKTAPVYYSMGNDEIAYMRRHGRSVLNALTAAGATILDESYQDIIVNGNRIRIGGLYALAFQRTGVPEAEWRITSRFLSAFEDTDALKILLCHRPDSFIFNDARMDWDIDLLLSGHVHGGLVRIPFIGGLVAAGQGLMPKYDYGRHQLTERMTMVITSGLTGYKNLPRIWNRREIVVLQLKNSA